MIGVYVVIILLILVYFHRELIMCTIHGLAATALSIISSKRADLARRREQLARLGDDENDPDMIIVAVSGCETITAYQENINNQEIYLRSYIRSASELEELSAESTVEKLRWITAAAGMCKKMATLCADCYMII